MSGRQFIDKWFGKAISKTFTVFLIATYLCVFDKLTGTEWSIIAVIYIGTQKAIDFMKALKSFDTDDGGRSYGHGHRNDNFNNIDNPE